MPAASQVPRHILCLQIMSKIILMSSITNGFADRVFVELQTQQLLLLLLQQAVFCRIFVLQFHQLLLEFAALLIEACLVRLHRQDFIDGNVRLLAKLFH
jgi:hypothetical protein